MSDILKEHKEKEEHNSWDERSVYVEIQIHEKRNWNKEEKSKKKTTTTKKAVSTVCGGEVTNIKGKSNFLVNKVVVDIFFDHQTFRRIPVTVIYAKRNWLIMM